MFKFLRDGDEQPTDLDWPKGAEKVRQAISEAMSARNIAVLLGAGCSSFRKDGTEVGIGTMAHLAREFCGETLRARLDGFYEPPSTEAPPETAEVPSIQEDTPERESSPVAPWLLTKEEVDCLDKIGVDLENYNTNLERLAEVLFSQRFVLRQSASASHWPQRDAIEGIIEKLKKYLLKRVSDGPFAHGNTTVRDLYERFYKKLVLRDRSLPRPWVFTTNYDLFNERAMDRLGIP
jgi:hypothetical protein